MKRSELIAQIKETRAQIRAKANVIQKQIEAGELPASAQGTFFKSTVDYWKKQPIKGNFLKMGVTRLNKEKLSKLLATLEKVNNSPTSTVSGVKNRLEEERESAIAVLVESGFTDEEARGFSAEDLTWAFKIYELVKELYHVISTIALQIAHELIEVESANYLTIKDIYDAMKNGVLENEERIVRKYTQHQRK